MRDALLADSTFITVPLTTIERVQYEGPASRLVPIMLA